ncbi:unnamed protein product [Plutella xylostella]|uniref:(diamondback moth) hypothetical protein n=1 Tax=Plutella xylostella TaxID=51655 RepID=A0A8S4G040_PLUXY|nr:unnamed protein product [Plutella xylostella]
MFANHFKVQPSTGVRSVPAAETAAAAPPETPTRCTPRDVARVVRGMTRGKSPGVDGLSIEHVLYAGDEIFRVLSELFNACIENSCLPKELMRTVVVPVPKNKTGDLSRLNNYRPISLGTVIGKILERFLQPALANRLRLDDAQFGFRPGLATDSAIFSLKHTVKYYTERGTSVYACFLDLSRAFDLVNYNLLWEKLKNADVNSNVVSLLRYWYENQTNSVKWGDTMSNDYRLECGVRQGGLTSPDLFNLYINDLIEELRGTGIGCHVGGVCVNNLSYADDMVLLSPSIKALRRLLAICARYAEDHGLKYNEKKTEMMVFKAGRGPDRVPPVFLKGSPVQVVNKFKYLGHILSSDLSDEADIERERRALAVRCNMLARRFARATNEVKITLFKAYCQSLYTSQLWFHYTKRAFSVLRVQYNDAFRILMRLPRFCSASGMFAEARVPDFFAIIRTKIASFWDRLLGNLRAHLLTHSACSSPRRRRRRAAPPCPHCARQLADHTSLMRHIRTHTGELPYKCPYCARAFIDSWKRKVHLMRQHRLALADIPAMARDPPRDTLSE